MCLVFKTTYIDRGKPLREGAFFFTRRTLFPPLDKRNTRDKAKGVRIASERHIGELGVRCLSTINRAQDSAATVSYRSSSRPILLHAATYIGQLSEQYRFIAPFPKRLNVKSKKEPLLPARKGTERRGAKSAPRRSMEGLSGGANYRPRARAIC